MQDIVKSTLECVQPKLKKHIDKCVYVASKLYQRPETAFQEEFACDLLCGTLSEAGFVIERPLAELDTAFAATLSSGQDGPTVGIIAEYDALPEIGHGCGHNLFAATSLGAALTLADIMTGEQSPAGTVKVIGTPAEEKGGGKCIMAEAGVFDGLDVALMIHPSSENGLGGRSLALSQYFVSFQGKAAHAAANPEEGVNALAAMINTFNNLNALREHLPSDAYVHGIILEGGTAANVVPDYTEAEFLLRSADENYQEHLISKFKDCARAAALASGCEVAFDQTEIPYRTTKPNRVLEDLFRACFTDLGEPAEEAKAAKGSSDVGNLSHRVPTIQASVALGTDASLHSREFADATDSQLAQPYLERALSVLSAAALACLSSPEIVDDARSRFEAER